MRYYLDGWKEISSHDCLGFIHTAQKDKRDSCAACSKPITKGQTYIELNQFDPYIFHKGCYLGDIPSTDHGVILGVGTKIDRRYSTRRRAIICKKFSGEMEE